MSELPGVVRVHPFGHNGKVIVVVKDRKSFTKAVAEEALKGAELRLRRMKRVASA